MGYRGRLIWPFKASISRLDTLATANNAIAGQPAGYDHVFREPVTTSDSDSRLYRAPVMVTCQVRTEIGAYERQRQYPAGRELDYDVRLCLHYSELEASGLVTATGASGFQPSDRLDQIYKADGTTLVRDYTADELYCVHVQDRSFGLSGGDRNLVLLYFKDRTQGVA